MLSHAKETRADLTVLRAKTDRCVRCGRIGGATFLQRVMKTKNRICALSVLAAAFTVVLPVRSMAQTVQSFSEGFTTTDHMDGLNTTAYWDTAGGQLKLFPFQLTLAGETPIAGSILGVTISGDYAYLTNEIFGLQVIDISDPTTPVPVGDLLIPGTPSAVAISGDYAFVGVGPEIIVVDISDPTTPVPVGGCPFPGETQDMAISGDYAYVAGGSSGLFVIDISDPSSPIPTVSFPTPGSAMALVISGDYAFVLEDPGNAEVFDISVPLAPVPAGTFATLGPPKDIIISGDYAFVIDELIGLFTFDISNPLMPGLGGIYPIPAAQAVAISGDYAYVASGSIGLGLQVLDISDPFSPSFVGDYPTPGGAMSVAISGNYAYVGDDASGLQVIEIAKPAIPPRLAASYDTPGLGIGVAISGDYAYVADGAYGLTVMDISDPTAPVLAGGYDTPGFAYGVAFSGDYAYVADMDSGLQVIDITDPKIPVFAGSYDTPGSAYHVAVSGDYAYVADGAYGLTVLDISDPFSPSFVGSYATPGGATSVAISGDYAYVADIVSGLQVIDITDPTIPVFAGSYDTPGNARGVAVWGDYAYVADWTTLQVIDISNPMAPLFAGSYDCPDGAYDVAVSGDYAYVADMEFGLQVIDITDPTAPLFAGSCETPGFCDCVVISGDYAYVASQGATGLQVIQVFQREVDSANNVAQSYTISSSVAEIGSVRLNTIQTDSIAWSVTADGGLNWEEVTPGAGWHDLVHTGGHLRWRSDLLQVASGVNPTCDSLFIEWVELLADADGDGVPDATDLCPAENSSFFDRDGDGCIDEITGARDIRYWEPDDLPVLCLVNSDGAPGVPGLDDLIAIAQAINTWSAVSGADLVVYFADTTETSDAQALDGENLITFADTDISWTPDGIVSISYVSHFTTPSIFKGELYRPGRITDVDVLFNPLYTYQTTGGAVWPVIDVEAAMAHEVGHIAGLDHSAIRTSTMALGYRGEEARTLEPDDELALVKAYPTPEVLANANRVSGTVYNTDGSTPLPGAVVFVIDAASGDTLACDYTLPDGGYTFIGLPDGNYYVSIYPLNGRAEVDHLRPVDVYFDDVLGPAVTLFVPDSWTATETNYDDPTLKDPVNLSGGSNVTGIDIIANEDTSGPEVVSITPEDGETGVSTTTSVTVLFDEPVDAISLGANFDLVDTLANTVVPGSGVLLIDQSTFVLTPASLADQTVYKVVIETGLLDKFGNNMASAFVSHFTTEFAQPDGDGDGVPDVADLCPEENSSYFDRDGDGCIDPWIGSRQTSYWAPDDMPFEYWINEDGAYGIGDGSDFTAVQDGMNEWAAVSGVDFSVSYMGPTAQNDARPLDGINLVTFEDPDLLFFSGVIAVGLTTTFTEPTVFDGRIIRPGQIVDADMIFSKQRTFSTTSMGSGPDIESVAVHEAGHLFGLFHSATQTSSTFYILPPGREAASLSLEDAATFFRGYHDPSAAADANILTGTVRDSLTGEPVPGAIVFAISAITGDTLGCEYTLPPEILPTPEMPQEGSFCFSGLPDGDYYVAIYPLNGTSPIRFLEAYNVSALLDTAAVTSFVPEYWDIDESASDDPAAMTPIVVVGGDSVHVDLILNVDTDPPTVLSVAPQGGEGNVRNDAAVIITFSEPIDVSTLSTGTFSLTPSLGGASVGGLASFPKVKDDSLLAFTPFAALDFATSYRLTLETGITDKFGNSLADPFVSEFTVEDQPAVSISSLSPNKGIIGSKVTISGLGFSPAAEEDDVLFSGVQAVVDDAQPNQLVVTVPDGIPTGALVSVKVGPYTSGNLTFTVLPTTEVARGIETGVVNLAASPRSLAVKPGGNDVYVATESGVTRIDVAPGATFLDHETVTILGGLDELDINPQGNRIYAVGRSESALHVIDVSNPLSTMVLQTLPVGAQPTGIVVDPRGDRAYVATDASEIQIWDISRRRLPTQAHAEQIGTIPSFDPNLRKKMAIDPVRNHLLALSGQGKILFFDLNGDSLLSEISVGTDPRDIVIDPFARRAYVSDATGTVTAVRLDSDPPSQDGDIYTGGTPLGMTITPAGRFIYATNRDLDLLQAIDLLPGSAAYRSVAATIPHRDRPLDIDISPDGDYAYSIAEGQNQFVVTTIGLGPTLKSLSPIAGQVGTRLVLHGDGFGEDPLQTTVSFNGLTAAVDLVRETVLEVTVPPGAATGNVTVERSTPSGPTVSNALPFEVLGASSGALRLAARLAPAGGPELEHVMAVSPKKDLLLVAERTSPDSNGLLHVLDLDPRSATYNQFMDTGTAAPFDSSVADLAVSPDGKRAFVVLTSRDTISVVDVDRYSSTFGKQVDVITTGSYVTRPTKFAVSPDGEIGLALRGGLANIIDLVEGSPTRYQAVDSVSVLGSFEYAAFHPSGTVAYLVGDGTLPAVHVVDVDPTSVDFGNLITSLPFPSTEHPRSISFTPDGDHCLVLALVRPTPSDPYDRMLFTIDSTDLLNPVLWENQVFGTGSLAVQEVVDVSPRGDRAVFHIEGAGFEHIDLTTEPYVTVETAYGSLNLTNLDIGYTPDASAFYAISADNDSIYVFDFNEVQTMAIVSGDLQTGVVNCPLASPLCVRVIDDGANPVEGIPVTFEVQTGGGILTSTNAETRTVSTDANGIAAAVLQLGGTAADSANSVEVMAVGLLGSPVTFYAHAVPDPLTQPLSCVSITPADGTDNVDVLTAMQMTFSRGVNPSSATISTFYLRKSTDPATEVPAIIGFTDLNRKLSLSPIDPLEANTTYIVEATTGLRDESGGALELAVAKSFTTEPPPPLRLASIAAPSALVAATVVLAGTGFESDLGDNTVLFGDEVAELSDGSTDFLQAVVPLGATSDSVRVMTTTGTSNALFFGVLAPATSPVNEVLDGINTTSPIRGIAINPAGTWAYAISIDPPVVIPIDIAAGASYPGIPVGTTPTAIDIHPNGKYAYVANFGSNTVTIINIDPTDDQHFNTPDTTVIVGANPIDLVASPLGDRVYVANIGSREISVLDVEEGSATFNYVIDSGPVNEGARAVAISPAGTLLYVGTDDGYVVLDTQEGLQVVSGTDKKQASKQVVMSPAGTRLYVLTTEGDLFVYDIEPGSPTENEVTDSVSGRGGKSVAMSPAGTLLYLTLESDQVLVFAVEEPTDTAVIEDSGAEGISELRLIEELYLGSDLGPIAFDPTGSGLALVSSARDQLVLIINTSDASVGALECAIEVTPRTLSLKSRGRWVMGRIELTPSPPYHVQDINISTVLLNGIAPANTNKYVIEDANENGIDELVVQFDRVLVQSILPIGSCVEVTITGTAGTRTFAGMDTICTNRPKVMFPSGGDNLVGGSDSNVTWTSPEGCNPDAVDVHWTPNDGIDWYPIAQGIPNAGSVKWSTPSGPHDSCRVMITLYENGLDLGMGMSDGMFKIEPLADMTLIGFDGTIKEGTPVVQWTTGLELNIEGFHILRAEEDAGGYERLTPELIPSRGKPGGADYVFCDGTARPNQDYFYKLQLVSGPEENREFGPFKVVFRASFSLDQNFPNPFSLNTMIRFTLPRDSHVDLAIYDVAGRLVKKLIDEKKRADFYRVVWDGTDIDGERVATGVYFYHLQAGKFKKTRKMIMLR